GKATGRLRREMGGESSTQLCFAHGGTSMEDGRGRGGGLSLAQPRDVEEAPAGRAGPAPAGAGPRRAGHPFHHPARERSREGPGEKPPSPAAVAGDDGPELLPEPDGAVDRYFFADFFGALFFFPAAASSAALLCLMSAACARLYVWMSLNRPFASR